MRQFDVGDIAVRGQRLKGEGNEQVVTVELCGDDRV